MCENTYEKYMMEYQKAVYETYRYIKDREVASKEDAGQALKYLLNRMRNATTEEREGVNDYIKSISHPIEGDILTPTKNDIHTMPCNLQNMKNEVK